MVVIVLLHLHFHHCYLRITHPMYCLYHQTLDPQTFAILLLHLFQQLKDQSLCGQTILMHFTIGKDAYQRRHFCLTKKAQHLQQCQFHMQGILATNLDNTTLMKYTHHEDAYLEV